jgi:DNA invertase Pin-like site-specific DNA recombinase
MNRFARSLRQLVNALEEFRALGIEFVSLHEGVDPSTPHVRPAVDRLDLLEIVSVDYELLARANS